MDWVIIGPGNGLSPVRRQAITWTNAVLLSTGRLGAYFSEIWIGILSFSIKEIQLKMLSATRQSFYLGLNKLIQRPFDSVLHGPMLTSIIIYTMGRIHISTFLFTILWWYVLPVREKQTPYQLINIYIPRQLTCSDTWQFICDRILRTQRRAGSLTVPIQYLN